MLNSANCFGKVVCAPSAVLSGKMRYPVLKYYIGVTLPSVESHIIKAQLRWADHLARMEDHGISKALFFGQLGNGK